MHDAINDEIVWMRNDLRVNGQRIGSICIQTFPSLSSRVGLCQNQRHRFVVRDTRRSGRHRASHFLAKPLVVSFGFFDGGELGRGSRFVTKT
jgi:hypothetical protein